jgi:hypothetical protein
VSRLHYFLGCFFLAACDGGEPSDERHHTGVPKPRGKPLPEEVGRACTSDTDCGDLVCVEEGYPLDEMTCQVPCNSEDSCFGYAECLNCDSLATPSYCAIVGCSR